MGTTPIVPKDSDELQSRDRQDLLDVIDRLRSQGVTQYIDLPEMIVVGDQSAGKSSVLEAISGVSFPAKDNLCTRFATELILRRSEKETATVSIVSGEKASATKENAIRKFGTPSVDFKEFQKLYDDAKEAMGIDDDRKRFSKDVLRIEICGRNQPHLTLIDLPGLFHASEEDHGGSDAEYVKEMVMSYMKRPRTVILAVVSAKNDFALQIATKYTKEIDPQGRRTLGVITKPDTVHKGSDSEISWINMAQNKKVNFDLGWHVIRNRDFTESNSSAEARDEAERKFFATGAWGSLPAFQLGVGALRSRLSTVLSQQIQSELPNFIQEVEGGIQDCRQRLSKLGDSRNTPLEQRNYLQKMSHEFSALAKAAIDGVYGDPFFGHALTKHGAEKRLRAVVQNVLLAHAKDVQLYGRQTRLTENEEADRDGQDGSDGRVMSRGKFIDDVVIPLMRCSRGCELPGTFNPLIIGDLFYRESKPWKSIIECCAEALLKAARATITHILDHTADESTVDRLCHHLINPAMRKLSSSLDQWVKDILEPHQQGHPITYNHYFTENIQKARMRQRQKDLDEKLCRLFGVSNTDVAVPSKNLSLYSLRNALSDKTEPDMDRFACSQAVDCMEAYYKVAMKMLVDNFGVLGIEKCLLRELPKIFSPEVVANLDEKTVRNIAAEPENARAERDRLESKLNIFETTLQTLHGLDRLGLTGSKTPIKPDKTDLETLDTDTDDRTGEPTPVATPT